MRTVESKGSKTWSQRYFRMHKVPCCALLDPNIVNSTQTQQLAANLPCYGPYDRFWGNIPWYHNSTPTGPQRTADPQRAHSARGTL
mmetsp:Transcript_36596/g.59856  ORF Transcript_36596/g.59856 Transcript_36596/m.59856 type:complete len:86 (+) Transcript_36596:491-748(+)